VPTLAILAVNYLIERDPGVREYGVTEIAEAVTGNKRFITLKGLFLKIIASILSLATGYSVGNEGPSAAIGAMIAHKLNALFNLPRRFVTLLISIGASSGIAAVFVSPVTGITFALENIAGPFLDRFMGPIILGAAVAFGVAYQFLEPLVFHYSAGRHFDYDYLLASLLFLPVIILALGLYLILKKRLLALLDWSLHRWAGRWRNLFFALIGGMTVGTLLHLAPIAAFSGHQMVAALINGQIHISLLLILAIVLLRILATVIAIYANAVGGLFLPLMSIGALVGYGYGEALNLSGGFAVHSYAFAAIGAAVFMGVVMRLPLTAVVLALEITYDYNIIVPTAVTVVLSGYLMNRIFGIEKLTADSPASLRKASPSS
jgi:CIC family chloride channel protein